LALARRYALIDYWYIRDCLKQKKTVFAVKPVGEIVIFKMSSK